MSSAGDLTELVKRAAGEVGFDLAGIAPVSQLPELQYFCQWIADGRAGEMRYLESREHGGKLKRVAVDRVFPWARSAVVCAINYNALPVSSLLLSAGAGRNARGVQQRSTHNPSGWISRYAWSQRDYHPVVMERLRRLESRLREAAAQPVETRCYVDTGPLVERVYAGHAGIGWVGKNTCIINQRLGSWLFLGVILTSLELDANAVPAAATRPSHLTPDLAAPDRCGTCTRCLKACPTDAFLGPRQLDAARCISYLTIEKRGYIPEELREGMGRHVFGCDICQDVCPWNRKAPVTTLFDFQPRAGLANPDLEWLATISEEDFRQTFRGSPIRRAKRTGLRRNAVVAMGNSGNMGFLPLLRELAHDPDSVVAEHARWAIKRLSAEGGRKRM